MAVLGRLRSLTSWPRCPSPVVRCLGPVPSLLDGELLFPGARLCCDHAAPAGGARFLGVGAHHRLRRDSAAPPGVCASGTGAHSRLRRDRAALAGCKHVCLFAPIHAGVGMGTRLGLCMTIHVLGYVHANSCGTSAYGNSRVERGHDDRGGTKLSSTSALCMVGSPAVEEHASLQQAPGRVHDEAWAGRV